MAPLIMRPALKAVLAQDEMINSATLAYIDNIHINEDLALAESVREDLELNKLTSKDPQKYQNGATMLELEVWWERGRLRRRRGSSMGNSLMTMTRRGVFFSCGHLVGHFSVCYEWRQASLNIEPLLS